MVKKWGRIAYLSVLSSLVFTLAPICVQAEEDEATIEKEYSLDNDDLYDQYIEYLMSLEDDISLEEYNGDEGATHYNASTSKLTKYGKIAYEKLLDQVKQVADGERESTQFTIPYSEVYGEDETFTFTASELGMDKITNENSSEAISKIYDSMVYDEKEPALGDVYGAAVADRAYCFYWSSGRASISSYPSLRKVSHTDDTITVQPMKNGSFSFEVEVTSDYAKDGTSYKVDTTKTSTAKNAIDYAKEIVKQAQSLNDREKLTYYKESICDLVEYDFSASGYATNPRQIVFVFDQDKSTNVVCEGYAKAFKYLCDLTTFSSSELECKLATGYMIVDSDDPGLHMWNIVQLKKNENYLVDVTNCDDGMFGQPDILFMCGGIEKITVNSGDTEFWGYRLEHPRSTVVYLYDNSSYIRMRNLDELILVTGSQSDQQDQPSQSEENPSEQQTDQQDVTENDAKAFVKRLYVVCLGREAEETGLNEWTNKLLSGEKKAVDIVQGVLCSPEYSSKGKSNGEVVNDCYQAMLGRSADEGGYADWTSQLDAGMSVNAIFAGFVGSEEFGNLCASYGIQPGTFELTEERDKNAGVTKFVSRLYTKALGRAYDVDGLNDWCGKINANPSRENILNISSDGFFHSQEFVNKNLDNTEFVKVLYRTFLGREYDDAGLADWVGKLNRGEMTRDGVISGFANSAEFSNIMAQYGL